MKNPWANPEKHDEFDSTSFRPIKENPIILDFSSCKYPGEIHLMFQDKFGFPDYYGQNWDALWDCLNGRFDGLGPFTVEVRGFSSMEQSLRDYCSPMKQIFYEVQESSPNLHFSFIS